MKRKKPSLNKLTKSDPLTVGLLATILGLLLLLSSVPVGAATDPDVTDLYSMGSGEFITTNCDLVTAAHVVNGATDIRILVNGKWVDTDVLAVDQVKDVAILHAHMSNCEALTLNTQSAMGDTVFALGFPRPQNLHWEQVLTKGIISSENGDEGNILTDLNIAPGNSGGALLNDRGQLIGITNEGYGNGMEFGSSYSLSSPTSNILSVIAANKLNLKVTVTNTQPSIVERLQSALGDSHINRKVSILVGNFRSELPNINVNMATYQFHVFQLPSVFWRS